MFFPQPWFADGSVYDLFPASTEIPFCRYRFESERKIIYLAAFRAAQFINYAFISLSTRILDREKVAKYSVKLVINAAKEVRGITDKDELNIYDKIISWVSFSLVTPKNWINDEREYDNITCSIAAEFGKSLNQYYNPDTATKYGWLIVWYMLTNNLSFD